MRGNNKDQNESGSRKCEDQAINRRNILLGSSSLMAAAALTSGALAQAQKAAPAASSGRKPNILLIMADDIGWFDVGAYNHGIMGGRQLE